MSYCWATKTAKRIVSRADAGVLAEILHVVPRDDETVTRRDRGQWLEADRRPVPHVVLAKPDPLAEHAVTHVDDPTLP